MVVPGFNNKVAATFKLRKGRKAIASIRRLKPAATNKVLGLSPTFS